MPDLKTILRPRLLAVYAAVFWLAALAMLPWAYPDFSSGVVYVENMPEQPVKWPFFANADHEAPFRAEFTLQLGALHPMRYTLYGVNITVYGVRINGRLMQDFVPVVLDIQNPAIFELPKEVSAGKNTITLEGTIPPGRYPLLPCVSARDPMILLLMALCAGGVVSALAAVRARWQIPVSTLSILAAGICLRIFTTAGTPLFVRAHDVSGHIVYIKYLAEHWTIPERDFEWVTYHPPLYYVFPALWMRLTGQSTSAVLHGQWQFLSLVFSVASLVLCVPIARMLFTEVWRRNLFLCILAAFPGLIFMAARISNDALYSLLSFAWLYVLLRAWQSRKDVWWIIAFCVLGIAMLVKATALVLIAATGLCVILCPNLEKRIRLAVLLPLVVLALSGWFHIPRALDAPDPGHFLIANMDGLGPELLIPRRLENILTFNPVAVIRTPFNNPYLDEYRRMFYPEFYFKSSLFDEWTWSNAMLPIARLLVVVVLACLPLIVLGAIRSRRDVNALPMLVASGSMLLASATLVWCHPYIPNQDFRYQVLIVAPFAYYLAWSARRPMSLAAIIPVCAAAVAVIFLVLLVAA